MDPDDHFFDDDGAVPLKHFDVSDFPVTFFYVIFFSILFFHTVIYNANSDFLFQFRFYFEDIWIPP